MSSGANPSNEFLSPCEWYAKALLSVTKFHELPRWSDLSLSEDDVEFISSVLHVVSVEVSSNIDADMCVIWLVQQTRVNHIGNWVVPSLASLVNLSFRGGRKMVGMEHTACLKSVSEPVPQLGSCASKAHLPAALGSWALPADGAARPRLLERAAFPSRRFHRI